MMFVLLINLLNFTWVSVKHLQMCRKYYGLGFVKV